MLSTKSGSIEAGRDKLPSVDEDAYGPRKGLNPPRIHQIVRDPDFQPERCGRRAAKKEGRRLCPNRNCPSIPHLNISENLPKTSCANFELRIQKRSLPQPNSPSRAITDSPVGAG